jgi:hypothetical protein
MYAEIIPHCGNSPDPIISIVLIILSESFKFKAGLVNFD